MSHEHGTIRDRDPHFIIDPITRTLSTESRKIVLVQGDHLSERFTFEIPQEMEGHQMSRTDKVEIHYINIDQLTRAESKGMNELTDVEIVPASGDKAAHVSFSWLIPHTATTYQGPLNFVVRFICEDTQKGNIVYTWSTAIYSGVSVTNSINNGSSIITPEYYNTLKTWETELKANQIKSLKQTKFSTEDEGANVWTATFGDGRTQTFTVRNGSRGPTGLVGSIETKEGQQLDFSVCKQAAYDALSEEEKLNLFAIITDEKPEIKTVTATRSTGSTQYTVKNVELQKGRTYIINCRIDPQNTTGYWHAYVTVILQNFASEEDYSHYSVRSTIGQITSSINSETGTTSELSGGELHLTYNDYSHGTPSMYILYHKQGETEWSVSNFPYTLHIREI